PVFSQAYITFADTPEHSIQQQRALTAQLKQYQGQSRYLIFLTSFGQAHNGYPPVAYDFGRLAQQIGLMGGTYEAIYPMNFTSGVPDSYSLVSWTDPATGTQRGHEAGSLIPTSQGSGVLQGALGRIHEGNWYRPLTAAPGPSGNLEFYKIIGMQPVQWPV